MIDPNPEQVDRLVAAHRRRGLSAYADVVWAARRVDFTSRELDAAYNRLLVEARASLIVANARRRLGPDPRTARLMALLDLPIEELDELREAGLLSDDGHGDPP